MGVVLGVDGGNSKTELLAVDVEGEPLAYVRGPGSNSHAVGAEGCIAVVRGLVERAGINGAAERGALFLCGADMPHDIAELERALEGEEWVRQPIVDNDTFALLRTGSAPGSDAVAVVCGSGINCVGRASNGDTVRYPSLGWETGDWGGSGMLGREVLFLTARAEDGRGEPTVLADVVRQHFGATAITDVGAAVHYGKVRADALGELAPAVLDAAEGGDAVARRLVARLADEIVLMAARALADLGLENRPADVVLGGGMIPRAQGLLVDEIEARLRQRAPKARPVVVRDPPVLGAALAALDAAGAPRAAEQHLRAAFGAGLRAD